MTNHPLKISVVVSVSSTFGPRTEIYIVYIFKALHQNRKTAALIGHCSHDFMARYSREALGMRLIPARVDLIPRACDHREGTRGSGIIRFREESDWPLKWNV